MSGKKKALVLAIGVGVSAASLWLTHVLTKNPPFIRGAVLTNAADPTKELPIADVQVSVLGGPLERTVQSDASGYFAIPLPWRIPGRPISLRFEHPGYEALDLPDVGTDRLYIAHLVSTDTVAPAAANGPEVHISRVVAQYSIRTTTTVNVGSAVRTFKVVNTGNVPCQGRRPCSPDGKWKAALGSASIDAGVDNEFHNARASCIAGPCPFTRVENNNFNTASHILRVSALNWSDTATFLLEAEVYKHVVRDVLRQSYPLIFDRALTFSLPAAAEGVSIEAEMNGSMIVFPLGPSLYLSWANCQVVVNKDQAKVYRCELKPGYQFSSNTNTAENNSGPRP